MSLNRTGEQGQTPVRNNRFLQKENYWYYTTREGVDIGPFDSQADAEHGVSDFIEALGSQPSLTETLSRCAHAA